MVLPYTSAADPLHSGRVGNWEERGWCLLLTVCFGRSRSPLTALTHSQTHPCAIGEGHQAQLYGHGETLFLSAFGYSILAKPAPKLHLYFPNMWQSCCGYDTQCGMQGTCKAGVAQPTPCSCNRHWRAAGCHGPQVRS